MRIGVIGMVCCLCSGTAAAQSLRSVVGPYSTSMEFDGQSVIYTYSNAREGRTSRAIANLSDIDLSLSSVHGESTIYLTLRCKSGTSCWDYGGPISPEQLYGDRLQYPSCESHAECQSFLDQLRSAALSTPEPYRPPPPPVRQPAPPETVIDGSNIPSRIDFPPRATTPKPAPASPRPPTPAPATPPPPPAPRTAPPRAVATTPGPTAPRAINDILDDLDPASAGGSRNPANSPQKWVEDNAESFLTDVFDDWADRDDGLFNVMADALRGLVVAPAERFVEEFVQKYMRDGFSKVAFGQSWESLPIEFRTDHEFMEATFDRVSEPFSLSAGFEHVNKLGELFDLWNER